MTEEEYRRLVIKLLVQIADGILYVFIVLVSISFGVWLMYYQLKS